MDWNTEEHFKNHRNYDHESQANQQTFTFSQHHEMGKGNEIIDHCNQLFTSHLLTVEPFIKVSVNSILNRS